MTQKELILEELKKREGRLTELQEADPYNALPEITFFEIKQLKDLQTWIAKNIEDKRSE